MLLIASESVRGHRALNDVVREMSLSASYVATPEAFADTMRGGPRRIVLVGERDVTDGVIRLLEQAETRTSFGLLVAAERGALRAGDRAGLVDRIVELKNSEWIGSDFSYERLAASARRVRRRLLSVPQRDLERAFDQFEFTLRYQPKVERVEDGRWLTREAEALVRWRHPEEGLLGPLEFLPEIEAYGMMARLTEFVLRKTAAQLDSWQEQGLKLNGCINFATSLLAEPDIGEYYARIVSEFGIDTGRITFELAEQDLGDPDAPHRRALDGLHEQGFRLCLDDFRIAAASLGTFERLPFDEIKVHAATLNRAQQDPLRLQVLAAITGLAHNLGMSVCAEGVEDQETFEFLKTIDCDKMQGFLISEAVLPHIIQRVYSAKQADAAVA